jgi:hypothetical protein
MDVMIVVALLTVDSHEVCGDIERCHFLSQ